MGGGGVMRAAAKIAGLGVLSGGIRGTAAADSMAVRNGVRPASSGVVPSTQERIAGLRVEPAVQKPFWEVNDWEFAGSSDDDLIVDHFGQAQPRLVFGPIPTLEETKQATSELKDALEKVYLSPPKSSGSVDSLSSAQETKTCVSYESSVTNSAVQAFKFLKESPAAQTVVASIACDPNVWNAVMQNPTLVEYLQSERKCAEVGVQEFGETPVRSDDGAKPDGLMGIFEDVKNSVLDMVCSLTNFIQSLFADTDSGKKSESSDGTSKTAFAGGTFIALAMMVIMVVVMKRG